LGIVGKALCFVMFILPNNTKQRALIFILLSKSGLIHEVIIIASASLSGGYAQNAERKLRLKNKLENKYILEILSPITSCRSTSCRKFGYFTLIFVFLIF
ncbi:hypothetical protein, partial [Methanosarcina mazei]